MTTEPMVDLQACVRRVQDAARRLQARSTDDLLAVIDQVVTRWLDPEYELRRLAEAELPATTGFSPEMIRHGLPLQFAPLRAAAIADLLDAELGSHVALDTPRTPQLITHVLAGNIPALAAAPMLLSLAIKAAVLVKPASGDPISAGLLRRSIEEVDSELAACLEVVAWKGGDARFEDIAFRCSDVVVASGSDAAVRGVAARVPGRFIGHGHRVSFALIGREVLASPDALRNVAERLAYDVTLWDQQGCLSPQLCYVESGGVADVEAFAAALATALADQAMRLPPRRRSFDEQAAVLQFRQTAEWQPGARLLASHDSSAWSISIESNPEFLPTCLDRCIRLKNLPDLRDLTALLTPHQAVLEAAGIAVDAAREPSIRLLLGAAGVPYVCPIGTMQTPSLTWRPGGRPRVADWLVE